MNLSKNIFRIILIFLLFEISIGKIFSQTQPAKIGAMVQVKNQKTQFRFFHSSPQVWELTNQYGVKIIRNKIQGGTVLETKTINIDGIKASDSTSAKWQPYFKPDSAAYYELFRLSLNIHETKKTPTERNLENSKDSLSIQTSLGHDLKTEVYFYAFIASCEKYNAAKLAGLAYDDSDVQNQYRYEYNISTNVPSSILAIGDTTITILPNYFTPNIATPKPKSSIQRKLILLSWNADSLKNTFFNYYVQRKVVGQSKFEQLNDLGLIKGVDSTSQLTFNDSIPNKTKKYVYRIVGKTYFDDFIVSDSIEVDYKQYLELQIGIDSVRRLGSIIRANWQVKKETTEPLNTLIKYYKFSVSNNDTTNFTVLQNNISLNNTSLQIPFSAVSAVVDTTMGMYYRITAIGIENDEISSPAYLVFSKKNTSRPSKPKNLAVAGTNQQNEDHYVVVSYSANPEPNIIGYKVFRQMGADTNLIEISGGIKNKLLITDSLSSKMEYPLIKYYVVAFNDDNRRSDPAIIEYTKKDTRGPISPIITNYTVAFTDVTLFWNNSPDTDIKETVLLRKLMNSQDPWVVVKVFTKNENVSEYVDKGLTKGSTYVYTMYATDEAGNNSCFDIVKFRNSSATEDCYQLVPVKITASKKQDFTDFKAVLTIEKPKIVLSWSYPAINEVESYEVFRAVNPIISTPNNSFLTSWKSFRPNDESIEDIDTKYTFLYTYAIRINFKDGTVSDLRTLTVKIPSMENCTFDQQIINSSKMNGNLNETSCYEIILQSGFDSNYKEYKAEIKK